MFWEKSLQKELTMSTHRFPMRGRVSALGVIYGSISERISKIGRRGEQIGHNRGPHFLPEPKPLTEEEVRNLPVAHRYSA